jgi:hypothetical protein
MLPFIPLNSDRYMNLSEDEIEHIDQYLFRFAKLQDAIGHRLIKAVLYYLGEQIDGVPLIDLFNKLEKMDVVEDYDNWMKLREVRNSVAHEYDDDPAENAKRINAVYSLKPDLENYYLSIENFVEKRSEI